MDPALLKKLDRFGWPLGAWAGRLMSLVFRYRSIDGRPMIVRPGGTGDLVVWVALEDLGRDPKGFFWIIERRSNAWAEHCGHQFGAVVRVVPGSGFARAWEKRAESSVFKPIVQPRPRTCACSMIHITLVDAHRPKKQERHERLDSSVTARSRTRRSWAAVRPAPAATRAGRHNN